MSATLVDGFDTASGDGKSDGLLEFRHVDPLLLHIGVATTHTSRVELGSTSPVGVASTHN